MREKLEKLLALIGDMYEASGGTLAEETLSDARDLVVQLIASLDDEEPKKTRRQ